MALRGVACNSGTAVGTTATLALTQAISGITAANPCVVTLSAATSPNPFSVGTQLTFSGVAGMVEINGLTATVTAIGGSAAAWTCTLNLNTASGFTAYSSGGTAAINMQAGDTVLVHAALASGTGPFFPSGFASISNCGPVTATNGQASATHSVAWKPATGTDVSYVLTWGSSVRWTTFCAVYSGRAANPFAVLPVVTPAVAAGAASNKNPLGINGINSNAGDDLALLVLAGGAFGGANGVVALTPPAGFGNSTAAFAQAGSFQAMLFFADLENAPPQAAPTLPGFITCTTATFANGYGAFLISLAQASQPSAQSGRVLRRRRSRGLAMDMKVTEWF